MLRNSHLNRSLALLLALMLLTMLLPAAAFATLGMSRGNHALLEDSIGSLIADYGYAYVMTTQAVAVYRTTDMTDPVFTISQEDAVLFAIEYGTGLKVCFLTEDSRMIIGYVASDMIADTVLEDVDVDAMAQTCWAELICTDYGELYMFVIKGEPVAAGG